MSKDLLCVGDGTPEPSYTPDAVTAVVVVIVVLCTLSWTSSWQDEAYALLAEMVAGVLVAAMTSSAHRRS